MIQSKRTEPRRGPERDRNYLDYIRRFGCVVCAKQRGLGDFPALVAYPSEAAHVGERGLGQKCSDRETLPMCRRHHREGPEAHHQLGRGFWAFHGMDRDKLLAMFQSRYDAEHGKLSGRAAHAG